MPESKTVIITGAAGSLGSALSARYASNGWNVVLLDKDERRLKRLYDEIVSNGGTEPAIYPADLAIIGPDDVATMAQAAVSEFGGLNELVHCAAHFDGLTPSEQTPPEAWLRLIQVNLNSAWLLTTGCLGAIRQSESGRVVFMLDDLETMQRAFWGGYGVSKHALRALVSQIAQETRGSSVQVLGVNPGVFYSPLRSEAYMTEDPSTLASAEQVAKLYWQAIQAEDIDESVFIDLQTS